MSLQDPKYEDMNEWVYAYFEQSQLCLQDSIKRYILAFTINLSMDIKIPYNNKLVSI